MEQARRQGPALVVDSGNALFKHPGQSDEASRRRARFILSAMGRSGTAAMAAGARDLNAGPEFLQTAAAKAKVTVLSANLVGEKRALLFAPSTVLTVGGVTIGLIGASPAGPVAWSEGVQGLPILPAVLDEAKKLRRKVDVVAVLAAVPYGDALQIAGEGKGLVDLVFQSHEGRGAIPPQRVESAYVLSSGERGRQLGRLELGLSGKGPFVDLSEAEREKQLVKILDGQIGQLKTRLQATKDEGARKGLESSIVSLEASRAQHQKNAAVEVGGRRTLRVEWIQLGPGVPSDPKLQAETAEIEPPGQAAH